MKKEVLRLEGITKIYGKNRVLSKVSFGLEEGEVHCLVGENGAGKSTLIKILSGVVAPEEGQISIFGVNYKRMSPKIGLALGISTIYQDNDLIPTLTVADNIFLDREITLLGGVINITRQNSLAQEFMDQFGVQLDPTMLVEDLSIGQRQMLQIIRALHRKAKVLVMDEPTTSLGEEEKQRLLQLVAQLATKGISVIYISHYFDEIYKIGHRATVIRDGEKVGTFFLNEISEDSLINKMVGRVTGEYFQRERFPLFSSEFSVSNVSRSTVVKECSFKIRSGEIFGLGGLVGSGRTELARLLSGADKPDSGALYWDNLPLNFSSPSEAIKSGICMISEDRKELGMFPVRSIVENITLSYNERSLFLNLNKDKTSTLSLIDKLVIKVPNIHSDIEDLSGGNQQKCIIARNLLLSSRVLIFDEPTKGVDIGAKAEIYKLIVQLAQTGKAIIVISSYMPELLSISDRIGVMREGSLVDILPVAEANEDILMKKYLGLASQKGQNV